MSSHLTVSQVAERLGCKPVTVRRAAVRLELGTLVTPRLRLLTEADVPKIKAAIHAGPGQPKKVKG